MAPSKIVLPVALLAALAGAGNVPRADPAPTTTVIDVFMCGLGSEPLEGSVISVGSSTTVVAVHCPAGLDPTACGLGDSSNTATVTQGPTNFIFDASYDGTTMALTCDVEGTNAFCTETDFGAPGGTVSSGVSAGTMSDYTVMMYPVTITSGADLLPAGGGSTASPTIGASARSAAQAGWNTTSAASQTSVASQTVASQMRNGTISLSTGGMPRPTQNAVLLGMAAAAFVGAVAA